MLRDEQNTATYELQLAGVMIADHNYDVCIFTEI